MCLACVDWTGLDWTGLVGAAWFPSAQDLIRGTAEADIWSTPLYDREPMAARGKELRGRGGGRVTVIGDACHPMSMFKGEGISSS